MTTSKTHASKLENAHFSEALTAFSVGWKDPENLAEILERIAPTVHVPRRFEFKRSDNTQTFLSESDDVRSIGSAFKRVEYQGQSVQAKTDNKGLTIRVDHDEIASDNWQEQYVSLLMQRLYRNELRRCLELLGTAAKDQKVKFDPDSNPDALIRTALTQAANKSGIRPNRLLFSESAWDARSSAYENKENSASMRAADMPPQHLAEKLLVEQVNVLRARYQQDPAVKSPILGKHIFAYYAKDGLTKDESSNLKRFVTPNETGSSFRVYLEENAKYTDITVEHYSNIIVTSNLGIQKLSIA